MMIRRFIFILIFSIHTGLSPSHADETPPESGPISLSEMVEAAYRDNPSIQSAKAAWRATVERFRVATAPPDPRLMLTYFPEPIETRLGPQEWNASISQMIPFPGKLSAAGEVVRAEAQLARLKLDAASLDVALAVRESFHELIYIRTARGIAAENAKLLDRLRTIAETAYAEDRATLLDVTRSQSQAGQIRYDMLLLEELERTEMTRLGGLLNRPSERLVAELREPPVEPPLFSLEEIYRIAETTPTEVRMADARLRKAKSQISLSRFENRPDFSVGLFYAGIGDPDVPSPPPDAGDDAIGLQFGVSIPLWSAGRAGRIAQNEALTEGAEAGKAAKINEIRTKIHTLWFKQQNARRLMDLYRDDLLPQALRAMQTAETWFREGEGSFSDFVEAQATAYNFQLSLARARADYGKALANLERTVGRPLTTASEAGSANRSEQTEAAP